MGEFFQNIFPLGLVNNNEQFALFFVRIMNKHILKSPFDTLHNVQVQHNSKK